MKKIKRKRYKRSFSTNIQNVIDANERINFEFKNIELGRLALSLWIVGDWENLSKIDHKEIENNKDRAKIAYLTASGLLQTGKIAEARQLISESFDWGARPIDLCEVLVSGVYNSLGRVALLTQQMDRAKNFFSQSLSVVNAQINNGSSLDKRIKYQSIHINSLILASSKIVISY